MLVLDATTGQNALVQAKAFAEVVPITALCLTKLDGTSKGGIVFAVSDQLGIPVRFIGTGEKPEDLDAVRRGGVRRRAVPVARESQQGCGVLTDCRASEHPLRSLHRATRHCRRA